MTTHEADRNRSRPMVAVGTLAAFVLGGVLLFGVYGKALDPDGFTKHMETNGIVVPGLDLDLTFGLPPRFMALFTLFLETLIGALLLFNVRRLWVLIPALLMTALFLSITANEWWKVEHGLIDKLTGCGCFGKVVTRTPKEAFFQDLGLLLFPALLAFLGRPKAPPRVPRRRTLGALGLAAAATVFAWFAPDIDALDDLGTKLAPGVNVAELCVGSDDDRLCLGGPGHVVPEIAKGHHLVILSRFEEPAMDAAVARLNAYADAWYAKHDERQAAGGEPLQAPEPWLFTHVEGDNESPWAAGDPAKERPPAMFQIRTIPEPLLTILHRRLPRTFLVHDGKVVATWTGIPPLPELDP